MTREQYVEMRNKGEGTPIYEFYKEKYDGSKHTPFLQAQEFFQFFGMWPNSQQAANDVFKHYDDKFEVERLEDLKKGTVIKYY